MKTRRTLLAVVHTDEYTTVVGAPVPLARIPNVTVKRSLSFVNLAKRVSPSTTKLEKLFTLKSPATSRVKKLSRRLDLLVACDEKQKTVVT